MALYEQIHQLVENTDVLRNHLIPKNTDVAQMQKERFFTEEDFNETRGPQLPDPKAVSTLQQSLSKTKNKVEAHLATLEEVQAEKQASKA